MKNDITRPKNLNRPDLIFHESEPLDKFQEGTETLVINHALDAIYYEDQALWIESVQVFDDYEKAVYRFKFVDKNLQERIREYIPLSILMKVDNGSCEIIGDDINLPSLKGKVLKLVYQNHLISYIKDPEII